MGSKVIRNVTNILKATSGRLFGRVTAGDGRAEELAASDVRTLLSVSTTSETAILLADKADLVGGVVPTAQIPAIAITEYLGSVASQATMLALVGDRGDWCLRSDLGTTWVLSSDDSTLLASWTQLLYPTAPVISVASRTGAVTLSNTDISGLGTLATQSGTFSGTSSGTNTGDQNLSSYLTSATAATTYQPVDADLTAIAGLIPANDDFLQRKAGAWTFRTVAQAKTDLGLTGSNSGDQTITLTGNVTGSGTGSFATTIGAGVVSNSMLAGSIALSKLTITGVADGTKFLRDDGSWQVTAGGGTGIASLNGLTGATQTFAVASTGTDFGISSSGSLHTFAIPDAGATARGLITTGIQTFAGAKTFSGAISASNLSGTNSGDNSPNSLYVTNAAHTGDATGATVLTLATVNAGIGSFGSVTQSVALTVNAKGLVTAASAATITPAIGSVTGLGTGVGAALAVAVGSAGAVVANGGALGTPASGNLANCTFPTLNQNTSGSSATVATILGLITGGTNVTITGAGTSVSPYSISSAGGASGIASINGNTTAAQLLTVGTAGTDFAIDSATTAGTSVFNIPDAGATSRGLVTTGIQTFAGAKTFSGAISASNLSGTNTGDQNLSGYLTSSAAALAYVALAGTYTDPAWIVSIPSTKVTGLGTLSTQNGTFSGTSSGTNTGDQDLSGYATTSSVSSGYQPLDGDLTSIAGLSPTNDDFIQRKAGVWANRTVAQVKTDLSLAGTNSGDQDLSAYLTSATAATTYVALAGTYTNPSWIVSIPNTKVTGLGTLATQSGTFSGTSSGTNTGDQSLAAYATTAAVALGYQPLDADLTAIAGLAATNDDFVQRKAGAWINRTVAQVKTDLSLTGTNSGDQTITLTGDVTGTGTGSFAATIAADSVTYAKMQNVSVTDRLLGRSALGAGDVEEIACTAAGRALIDDADTTAQRTTLGLGTLATQSGTFSGTSSGTNTGDNAVNSLYSGLVTNANHTGDATGSAALTLATVNLNVGSFGSATQSVALTVNGKGLVTAASASTITPAIGSVTGLGTGVGAALAIAVGTAGSPALNGGALGTPSSGTLTNCTFPTLNQNTTGSSATVATILGLITAGTNVTITGGGTSASPYSIAAAAGSAGITTLNALTVGTQTFAVGTGGTDFAITSATGVHTFSIPDASATARGLITTGIQTIAGAKTFSGAISASNLSGTNTGDNAVNSLYSGLVTNAAHTGDVTGSTTLTIGAAKVTLAKMDNVGPGTIFYRKTPTVGAPETQTLATLKTDLALTGTNSGDQTITLTGNVTGTGTGSFATTIAAGVVSNAMLAGSIALSKLTITGVADGTKFLRDDGSWQLPAGGESGLASLNTLTTGTQTFTVGTLGTDFGITSSVSTHTFNIPNASATARGLITTGIQTIAGAKTFSGAVSVGSLDISGDTLRIITAKTPASEAAAGSAGEICWDANNVYVTTATNTWKKTPLIAFGSTTTPNCKFLNNQYYSSFGTTTSALAVSNNLLHYTPFTVYETWSPTRIGINVTTAIAASIARLGIYNDVGGQPGGAPLLDAGTVSLASTGEKEIVISPTLPAGVYWLALAKDSLTGVLLSTETLVATSYRPMNIGSPSATLGSTVYMTASHSGAIALPTVSTLIHITTLRPPRIWLRKV